MAALRGRSHSWSLNNAGLATARKAGQFSWVFNATGQAWPMTGLARAGHASGKTRHRCISRCTDAPSMRRPLQSLGDGLGHSFRRQPTCVQEACSLRPRTPAAACTCTRCPPGTAGSAAPARAGWQLAGMVGLGGCRAPPRRRGGSAHGRSGRSPPAP